MESDLPHPVSTLSLHGEAGLRENYGTFFYQPIRDWTALHSPFCHHINNYHPSATSAPAKSTICYNQHHRESSHHTLQVRRVDIRAWRLLSSAHAPQDIYSIVGARTSIWLNDRDNVLLRLFSRRQREPKEAPRPTHGDWANPFADWENPQHKTWVKNVRRFIAPLFRLFIRRHNSSPASSNFITSSTLQSKNFIIRASATPWYQVSPMPNPTPLRIYQL